MEHLHKALWLDTGDVVEVSLDTRANVMLMDTVNYQWYQSGMTFRYHGGQALRSPVRLSAPHAGQWNVVIDLGGGSGSIRHSIRVLAGRN